MQSSMDKIDGLLLVHGALVFRLLWLTVAWLTLACWLAFHAS